MIEAMTKRTITQGLQQFFISYLSRTKEDTEKEKEEDHGRPATILHVLFLTIHSKKLFKFVKKDLFLVS